MQALVGPFFQWIAANVSWEALRVLACKIGFWGILSILLVAAGVYATAYVYNKGKMQILLEHKQLVIMLEMIRAFVKKPTIGPKCTQVVENLLRVFKNKFEALLKDRKPIKDETIKCNLMLPCNDNKSLRLTYFNDGHDVNRKFIEVDIDNSQIGAAKAFQSRKASVVNDVNSVLGEKPFKSFISIPLLASKSDDDVEVLGILNVDSNHPDRFLETDGEEFPLLKAMQVLVLSLANEQVANDVKDVRERYPATGN